MRVCLCNVLSFRYKHICVCCHCMIPYSFSLLSLSLLTDQCNPLQLWLDTVANGQVVSIFQLNTTLFFSVSCVALK